jgi:membrane fusion protein (multidrug efflux system)
MKTDLKLGQRPGATSWIPGAFPCGLLILVIAGLAPSGCKKAAAPQAPPPVVEVMKLEKKKVARSVTFIGQLDSPQNVEVRARVESFLDKILFAEGSVVKEGDPLFELDKRPYEEKLAAAKGSLAEAEAALRKSKLDVARLRPLVAKKAVSQKDLDDAEAALQVNEANVSSSEAAVKSAKLDISYCDIRAPLSGRIGAKQVPVGSLVGKGEPTLLATISQVDPIDFYCSLSEVDYLKAERLAREAGRNMGELPVTLILADGTVHPEPGKWLFLERAVDAATGTIRARAQFPNPDGVLRPGMFARVRVSTPDKEERILVPERALTELQGKYFVWVVDAGNKASQRPVEVDPYRVGQDAIILKGLKPGERIVVEGVQKLRDGTLVEPRTESQVAEAAAKAAEPGHPKQAGKE